MTDETKTLPLTIENAIAAMAREYNLVETALSGSVTGKGIMVVPKDNSRMEFLVVTREEEEKEALATIVESILADSLLDDLEDVDSKAVYEALLATATVSDLEPWLMASIREQVRSLAQHSDPKFWELWKESGLKPLIVEGSTKGVGAAFDLVKALQRFQTQDLTKPGQLLLELLDYDYENACDIVLEQCQIDIPALAVSLLKASGGTEGMSDGTFTSEGFVIHEP